MKIYPLKAVILGLALTACGTVQPLQTPPATETKPPPTPTDTIKVAKVNFTTLDNINLSGTLFGEGKIAVILAHQGTPGADQQSWHPFARLLAERGYTALTLDFRGVGQSGGKLGYGDLAMDVNAAAQFLHEQGYEQMVCIGASMGGTACIRSARDHPFIGLGILASTMMAGRGGDSLRITPDDLARLTQPKLFITGDSDSYSVVSDTKRMHELSPEPKNLLLLPGTAHGTNLFDTDEGKELTAALLGFLEGLGKQTLGVPQLLAKLGGPIGPVYSLAWSRDGSVLASAGYGQIKVWDAAWRQERITLTGHSNFVWGLAWSPDGLTLASASEDGTVKLWDSTTLENTTSFDSGWAFSVAWSPDSRKLAIGTYQGLTQIWDVGKGERLREVVAASPVISLAWSPDGKTLAQGLLDGKIVLWDMEVGLPKQTLFGNPLARSDTNGLAWSRDGSRLASAHQDGRIRIWDIANGLVTLELKGHDGWARGVAWSPDGQQLASSGEDATVKIWDVSTGEQRASFSGGAQPIWTVGWSPDGSILAAGDGVYNARSIGGNLWLWKTQTAKAFPSLTEPSSPTSNAGVLPNLQSIMVGNVDKIQLLRTMEIPGYSKGQISQCSLAFSPDGRLLVGACGRNQVPVWEVATGKVRHLLYENPQQIVTCAFNPAGSTIACAGFDKTITFWDATTGAKIRDLGPFTSPVWDLDFSPDGQKLVSANLADKVRLWDVNRGETIWNHEGEKAYLSTSASPSGKAIAYGGRWGTAGVLDSNTGESIVELIKLAKPIGDVTFSQTGKLLAAGTDDNTIYLWSIENYQPVTTFQGHRGYVNGVGFSPDETLLVSGSHDQRIGIWSIAGLQLIKMFEGHQDTVLRVAFSPDGKLTASISWDGTVRLWGVVVK